MEYKPYYYQQEILDKIEVHEKKRVLVHLATGGGKTVIFTTLAKQYKGRVLILVDSRELVGQTAKHFENGATFEAKDKIFPTNKIVVSMVQTLKSRLKKYPFLIDDFDLIIIDECHVLIYDKILEIAKCKILGFTATPVINKKVSYFFCYNHKAMTKNGNCCDFEKIEFTKDFSLSEYFDDIIEGIPISDLIEKGFLVPDENYVIPLNDSDFKLDTFGEVTNAEKVFNENYQMDILSNYINLCAGKKTMIFTQNTTLNKIFFDQFIYAGFNDVFMYDSVNDTEYNRSEVVDKFRSSKAGILFNVGVFTKGFDVTDVQAIIVARRVSSLSLWIQIVGRGSRVAKNIFKDKFIVIDGGTNIERLGRWSEDFNWTKMFWGSDDFKPKKEGTEDMVKECENCGTLMHERKCVCDKCDHNHCKVKDIEIISTLAIPYNVIPPNAQKIIEFSKDKDKIFALRILTNQIFDMFKKIPKEQFQRNINTGVERIFATHLKPNYVKIIQSKLPSSSNRTYVRQREILLTKLKKKYAIQ